MKNHLSRPLVSLLAASLGLGACASHTTMLPASQASQAMARYAGDSGPDAQVPSCKGQQTTKNYAQSQPQGLSLSGGKACVPKFKKYGGAIKYPEFTGNGVAMTVISSTTPYDPVAFPPSTNGIFYLQLEFNANIKFGTKMPAGASLGGPGFKVKKPYTIEAARALGSVWQILASCYTDAVTGPYGPMIGGLGYPLKNASLGPSNKAVIWVVPGKGTTQKC